MSARFATSVAASESFCMARSFNASVEEAEQMGTEQALYDKPDRMEAETLSDIFISSEEKDGNSDIQTWPDTDNECGEDTAKPGLATFGYSHAYLPRAGTTRALKEAPVDSMHWKPLRGGVVAMECEPGAPCNKLFLVADVDVLANSTCAEHSDSSNLTDQDTPAGDSDIQAWPDTDSEFGDDSHPYSSEASTADRRGSWSHPLAGPFAMAYPQRYNLGTNGKVLSTEPMESQGGCMSGEGMPFDVASGDASPRSAASPPKVALELSRSLGFFQAPSPTGTMGASPAHTTGMLSPPARGAIFSTTPNAAPAQAAYPASSTAAAPADILDAASTQLDGAIYSTSPAPALSQQYAPRRPVATPPADAAEAAPVEAKEGNTTLMIRNLPRDMTQQQLLVHLNNAGFQGQYDFVYLPRQFQGGENHGYAFINLSTSEAAADLTLAWHDRVLVSSQPTNLNITLADKQGLEVNLRNWRSPRVRRIRNPELRPYVPSHVAEKMMFGTACGEMQPKDSSAALPWSKSAGEAWSPPQRTSPAGMPVGGGGRLGNGAVNSRHRCGDDWCQ